MSVRTRARSTLAASLGAVLAVPLLASLAPPASAAAGAYVALGDSYSSGLGTRSYVADGTECRRSTSAYPALVAAARGYSLDFRACSGATVPDVAAGQVGALSASTSLVTISVGGNDAGFADVLTECALPGWASDCDSAIDGAQAYVDGVLPGQLTSLYADIRGRAPAAQVVVVGYPRVFMGEDCDIATFFSPQEQARLNETADLLNARTAAAASAAGFGFADPTAAFTGHAVCDEPEWLNGLSNPVEESYHPNVAGQGQGYTPLVSGSVGGAAVRADEALIAQAAGDAEEIAASQREHVSFDRTIEPPDVQAPDLRSPEVRRAAEEAGIDYRRFLARHS